MHWYAAFTKIWTIDDDSDDNEGMRRKRWRNAGCRHKAKKNLGECK